MATARTTGPVAGTPATAATVESGGLALGISDPETFEAALEETSISLNPGDTFIAYTDGVTEAVNPDGEEWGLNALRQTALAATAGSPAADRLEGIKRKLLHFVGDTTHPADDMTLVILRRKPGD